MTTTPVTLEQNQRLLPRYRYLENQMSELMGGWVQTIVDAEVKVAFGRHLFDDVEHSNRLKQRLPELKVRSESKQTAAPSDAFVQLLEEIWHLAGDVARLVALYRVLKPHYVERLDEHYASALPADEPTAILLQEISRSERGHLQWGERAIERLSRELDDPEMPARLSRRLTEKLAATGGITRIDQPAHYSFAKSFGYSRMPARDDRWTVIDAAEEYGEKNWSFETIEGKQHLLNDLLNSEFITVERLGQIIAEFPDIPWKMRVDLARQIWDEARHAEVVQERLEEVGGHAGMYPVNFWGWEVDVNRPDPLERLALSNATFESEACKHLREWIKAAHRTGDTASATVLEFILADEVTHVHFGQKWIDALTRDDPDRKARVLAYPRMVMEKSHPRGVRYDELSAT